MLLLSYLLLFSESVPIRKSVLRTGGAGSRCSTRSTCVECVAKKCGWDQINFNCVDVPVASDPQHRLTTTECLSEASQSSVLTRPEWRDPATPATPIPTVDKTKFVLTPKITGTQRPEVEAETLPGDAAKITSSYGAMLQQSGSHLGQGAPGSLQAAVPENLLRTGGPALRWEKPALVEPAPNGGWKSQPTVEDLAHAIPRKGAVGAVVDAEDAGPVIKDLVDILPGGQSSSPVSL